MRKAILVATLGTLVGFCASARVTAAATIQLYGAGSAVVIADAAAQFESTAALNPSYVEGGMTFTRVGLSNNNDGCGFAGCPTHPGFFPGFSNNYFYGANFTDGSAAYISIDSPDNTVFTGLELFAGTGFDPVNDPTAYWSTYLGTVLVGAGTFSLGGGATLVGFLNPEGFDQFRLAVVMDPAPGNASLPAIDTVTADLTAVPEPGTLLLAGAGMVVMAVHLRRRRR